MVFYVYNQGIRQEESLSRLLKEQQARKIQSTARTRKVAKKTRNHYPGGTGASIYEETKDEASRQPVLFAHQLMSSPVFTLSDQSSLRDAWKIFQDYAFHHIPIVNSSTQLTGVVSDSDVLRSTSLLKPQTSSHPASELLISIAKTPVISVSTHTSIRELAELMINRHIGCLPVVNEKHQVEGIVTRTDILRALVKEAPIELWA